MRFEFATATRILFGAGCSADAAPAVRVLGRRALVVCGRDARRAGSLAAPILADVPEFEMFPVTGEPTVADVIRGAARARAFGADCVIGFGGGSPIDAAKAVAALATNTRDPFDYLEVVGRSVPLESAPLPVVAVPTTAGTGAEVTRNAVLTAEAERVKVSLRDPRMLPRLAVVDPNLTLDLPRAITAATGMDALTQLIEAFVSVRAHPMVDGFCREGLGRAAEMLPRACADGRDAAAREGMSLAALLGGLALANGGLGAVHGFAAPIGGMFDAPHGAVCAALLPGVMQANILSLARRDPGGAGLRRFAEIARLLTGREEAEPLEGVRWIQELTAHLGIPGLGVYGLTTGDIPVLCEKAARANSMRGNPVPLEDAELRQIVGSAL